MGGRGFAGRQLGLGMRDWRGREGADDEIDEEWERGRNEADDPHGVFTKNCTQSHNGGYFVRWVSRVTLFSGIQVWAWYFQGKGKGTDTQGTCSYKGSESDKKA